MSAGRLVARSCNSAISALLSLLWDKHPGDGSKMTRVTPMRGHHVASLPVSRNASLSCSVDGRPRHAATRVHHPFQWRGGLLAAGGTGTATRRSAATWCPDGGRRKRCRCSKGIVLFRKNLQELGWSDGHNLQIDF